MSQVKPRLSEDEERGEFLRRLDAAPFTVTDWEAKFIEDFLMRTVRNWWTERRREACDRMRSKYQGRLA